MTIPFGVMCVPGMLVGIEEKFAEVFAQLERVSEYDGNPEGKLVARIGKAEDNPQGTPASMGYGSMYCVVFEQGKSCCCH